MSPLCDLCGTRHEKHQAHVFAKVIQSKPQAWITPLDNAKKPSYRFRDPVKRREQMREVMRRRRLRLKAA